VLTKADIASEDEQAAAVTALSTLVDPDRIMVISAVTGAGLTPLLRMVHQQLLAMLPA